MTQSIIVTLSSFPPEVATVLLAMLPVTELGLALPVAVEAWHLSPSSAFVYACIGTAIPFFPLYFGFGRLRLFLARRAPRLVAPVDTFVTHVERKYKKHFATIGALGLFLYVALPLPFTGVWSATILAVAFKVPFRSAALGILGGMFVIAAVITISLSGVNGL